MKKNNNGKIIFLFIVIGLLLFGILGYKVYIDFIKDDTPTKEISHIELYGYSLANRDSDLYKSKFKELETILNSEVVDYNKYATLVSELFVIDVYTLDNKLASTDIGGLQYLHTDLKENFQENMGATLYKDVLSNLEGNREQELPVVSEITNTSVFETTYTYNDKEYKAYLVTVDFNYEKDLGYQKSLKVTLIKDSNKLFIVKGE